DKERLKVRETRSTSAIFHCRGLLVEAECYFDWYFNRDGLTVGAVRGFAAPSAESADRGFIQAQAGALDHPHLRHAAIRRDNDINHDYSRIFCFARLVRVRRLRHIEAGRRPDAVDSSMKDTTASAATFTSANTTATAGAIGHVDGGSHGVAHVG